jgi:hypothetical protein
MSCYWRSFLYVLSRPQAPSVSRDFELHCIICIKKAHSLLFKPFPCHARVSSFKNTGPSALDLFGVVTAQLRWCNSGSQGKLDGSSVRWAFLSGNIRVVVQIAARGLKRQKFLLKVAVYCIRRHSHSHSHEVAAQLHQTL